MLSLVLTLTLAVAQQQELQPSAGGAPQATAPVSEDPIGALVEQAEQKAAAAAAPPAVSAPPSAPSSPSPSPAAPANEDEDAAEAPLPRGPVPYTSLPSTPTVRPNPSLFTNPMVRLPAAPKGTLDGGWVVSRTDGTRLYGLQFNDSGGGGEIEGAWRDLEREWSPRGSGPVASVAYEGAGLTIRFYERGRTDASVIQLQRRASGDWAGELQSRKAPTAVVMSRN